jgi:hypothetical protein
MASVTTIIDADDAASPSAIVESPDADRLERRRRELLDRHWTMLAVSLLVIMLSMTLRLNPSGSVGASWLPVSSLPPLCGSRALFGVECPGCGLTRSFVALGHGNWRESLRLHRVGWLLAAAVVLQIPYRMYSLWELNRRVPDRAWPAWCGNFLIAAMIANWVVKMLF